MVVRRVSGAKSSMKTQLGRPGRLKQEVLEVFPIGYQLMRSWIGVT